MEILEGRGSAKLKLSKVGAGCKLHETACELWRFRSIRESPERRHEKPNGLQSSVFVSSLLFYPS
jgi:hypothetical protein